MGHLECEALQRDVVSAVARSADIVRDDDLQLALFVLHGLHYGSVIDADDAWEWHPDLVATRLVIEGAFERELRLNVPMPAVPRADRESVAGALFELTQPDTGPSLSKYVARSATIGQVRELVVQRSIYTLKEADPHSWAIPRLTGRAKSALVEIQADEYGGGRPERMHSAIYAGTMRGLGLDDRYGAYVDQVPAITLASLNMMSMFGLNRRLRGAISGHLAAFEMTSSIPSRFYGNGFRRLGFGSDVTWYFDEHVEADAVHEQIAARDLAGSLAEDEPALLEDIMFGASACLTVDGWAGQHILDAWTAGRSSLRVPLPVSSGTPG
ncbi:iron-containing redox enzyme family protein [Glaciibacter sp. 2TAF33]|uniref:iron-containing redox enzyme family protein n=1 Tax=Glaciibacter sp. 2TAF33 TaxID=3233015 RepID=UPI003F8F7CDA